MANVITELYTSTELKMHNGIWALSITSQSGDAMVMINGTGSTGAPAGPKLQQLIDFLNQPQLVAVPSDYFVPYKAREVGGDFEFTYDTTNSKYLRIELSAEGYKFFLKLMNSANIFPPDLMKRDQDPAQNIRLSTTVGNLNLQWEQLPFDMSWLVKGYCVNVEDGDTIHLRVVSWGQKLNGFVNENDVLKIRFIGINTPETRNHDKAYGDKMNAQYAAKFKTTVDKVYDIAEEGKTYMKDIMALGNKSVIISVDSRADGSPSVDAYKRTLGMVYKPPVDLTEPLPGNQVINVNKTMISNRTSVIQDVIVPLADMSLSWKADNTRFGEVYLWKDTIAAGIDHAKIQQQADELQAQQIKALEDERKKLIYNNEKTITENTSYVIQKDDSPDAVAKANHMTIDELAAANHLTVDQLKAKFTNEVGQVISIPIIKVVVQTTDHDAFEIKYSNLIDNRLNFFDAVDDRRTMFSEYHLRIGDVQFVVPPLSFSMNRSSHLQKVKALRTKSSIITRASSNDSVITVQLYFHDLESINGFAVPYKQGQPEIHYYAKTKVDTKEYYYMDGLRTLIAQFKKAPFLPIENEYVNTTLDIHSVALVNLNVTTVPGFPHSLAATLTLARFEHDAYMPQISFMDEAINYPLLRWYYQDVMNKKHEKNPYRTYLAPIEGQLTNDLGFLMADEDELAVRQKAINDLRYLNSPAVYDDKIANGNTEISKFRRDADKLKVAFKQRDRYLAIKEEHRVKNVRFPNIIGPSGEGLDVYKDMYEITTHMDSTCFFLPPEFSLTAVKDPTIPKDGIIQIDIESVSTVSRIDPIYKIGTIYRLPADMTNESVALILQRGKDLDKTTQAYKLNFHQVKQKAIESEGTLPMIPRNIPGLYITSLQVMYENQFSSAQLENLPGPTAQYLGSQDPYIQMVLETNDRHAVEGVRTLLDECERFTREYRYGITSGFMGIDNQLLALFGITTVMPDTVKFSTVPGFPNRTQIEMTLVAFNKTQKRSEVLEGLIGTISDTTKEDRNVDNNPIAKDVVIIERKMKDLEVYPDLELPTFSEVNQALPYIGAGFSVYSNPSGAKYVDPDFYMSCKWTMRQHIMNNRDMDHGTKLQDLAGLAGTMKSKSDYFFEPDKNTLATLATIDTYSRQISAKNSATTGPTQQQIILDNPESYKNGAAKDAQSVYDWSQSAGNVYATPSMETWLAWQGQTMDEAGDHSMQVREYTSYFKNLKNPEPVEVYKEIMKGVAEKWVANGLAVNKSDMKDERLYNSVTYARVTDFYQACYGYLSKTDPSATGSVLEPVGISVKDYTKMAEASGKKGVPKITDERIANYLKALFKVENEWRQYTKDASGRTIPSKNPDSSAVGIAQMMLSSHGTSIADAQRLAWDWKYNIKRGIAYYFGLYTDAINSGDMNLKSRPWDWAVRAYEQGNFIKVGKKPDARLDTDYYAKWMSFFEGSIDTVDPSKRQDALFNVESARMNGPQGWNAGIQAYVQGDMTQLDKMKVMNAQSMDSMLLLQKLDTIKVGDKTVLDALVTSHFQEPESKRLLISEEDPRSLYRDSYTDMVTYDHKGRLLRAFPTFQMFIVDEGRWMTSYKLWDNMYGFNSISSIDVYRSRKIAADTCVIEMTNVYSNLTSRRLDQDYGDWQYSFWDNLFWGNPSQSIIDARKELVDAMNLETGARIHLRLGYGSDAGSLPVVFNGTITEMNADEVVTIIGQGDGLELSNVISADPGETNKNTFGVIREPRDLLCRLMTSRGNWFKDWINNQTNNRWFRENPLGIQHFGNPQKAPEALKPFQWFNENYGDTCQNIYSTNGQQSFSSWTHPDGSPTGYTWAEAILPIHFSKDAEAPVLMKLAGQTVWKVAQNLAYVNPDYIVAVHPFEMRSTLFFGKPYYRMAYRYDSAFKWVPEQNRWQRTVTDEIRKPFMQFHMFDGNMDIVSNKIKASEEGVYTNVIATYEGGQSRLMQADFDIRYDKQKTQVVQANLVHRSIIDFYTSEKQADNFAASTLRDYMKEMYKGNLLVLGDPTVKPYDMCYINDTMNTMNGMFQVKEVAHHFSFETGFVSSISPDAVVVIDDKVLLSHSIWATSLLATATGVVLAYQAASALTRKILGSVAFLKGKNAAKWTGRSMARLASMIPGGSPNIKAFQTAVKEYLDAEELIKEGGKLEKVLENPLTKEIGIGRRAQAIQSMEEALTLLEQDIREINTKGGLLKKTAIGSGKISAKGTAYIARSIVTAIKDEKTVLEVIKLSVSGLAAGTVVGILAQVGISILAETIGEMWRREKKSNQAVLMIPLKYQGREFTAGINGHKGMVVGDTQGWFDDILTGKGPYGFLGATMNFFFDNNTAAGSNRYSYTEADIINGTGQAPDGGLNTPNP